MSVPAIFLQMGEGRSATGESGIVINEKWDNQHLHQPSDDLGQPLDYAIYARFTELLRRFTMEAANMPDRPRWYADDYFGNAFAKSAPKARRPDDAPRPAR